MLLDISPLAEPNLKDSKIVSKLLRYEGTGRAIVEFDKHKSKLSDYAYWFMLSTLWVSYTGFSDLKLWKKLFSSNRAHRKHSIMKPSEVITYDELPDRLTVFRAKRPNESDCIAYTLDVNVAIQWALRREVDTIHCYTVAKADVLALFLRRNESEVIVLEQTSLDFIECITVISE
ncbi:hypothetical protein [Vibrio sp. Hal054]|uniref:hypothetical protein n=1 Tax=Vibrio sp. Hal054 TaxID=3035158 RepID=UPI00301E08B3